MVSIVRCMVLLGACLASSAWFASAASAQNWAERLGYPAGSRVVILAAREMGVGWEQNASAKELLEKGLVSGASVAVPAPWFEEFSAWGRQHSNHDVGLSVVLTNPFSAIHWSLLTGESGSRSLVDADGRPWQTIMQLAVNASAEEVQHELEAQLYRARAAGLKVTHLNSFHGVMFSRPDLIGVLLEASRRHWIPAPVVELSAEKLEEFRQKGFPVDEKIVEMVRSYPLPKLDHIDYVPAGETYAEKRERFVSMIENLAPGLTEIICVPAVESEGLKLLTDNWQQHVWDHQLLSDTTVIAKLQQPGVVVTTWSEVMDRLEHLSGTDPTEVIRRDNPTRPSDATAVEDAAAPATSGGPRPAGTRATKVQE